MLPVPGGRRSRSLMLGVRVGLIVILIGTASVLHAGPSTARWLRLLVLPVALVFILAMGWLARARARAQGRPGPPPDRSGPVDGGRGPLA